VSPEIGILRCEPVVLPLKPDAVEAGHSLQITRYALFPMCSLGQSTLGPVPKGRPFSG
jgi:hypothetical protein